jgi:hypothetical protein
MGLNCWTISIHDLGATGAIDAKDKDGQRVSLPFISCFFSQEMLGVKMTPTGEYKDQFNGMLAKSIEESGYIKKGNISQTETMQSIKTSIIPRLAWPLVCMSITKEDGKRLLRPVLQSALPKMGIVSTLGYDFIHGSPDCHGLGIPDLFHMTYAKQIETLIDHLWKSTQTGHFIMMAVQEFILEAGTLYHPFDAPRNSHLSSRLATNNTWIAALYDYTSQFDIRISFSIPVLPKQRINDASLMDILENYLSLSSQELRDVNVCRIYKRIFFLSDIFTGDGTKLSAFTWDKQQHSKPSPVLFNRQDYPIQQQWRSWTKAMHALKQAIDNQTVKALGHWTVEPSSYVEHWDYFFDTTTAHLFHRT